MPNLQEIAQRIEEADAILIGASNGLSICEGLHLFAENQIFDEIFGDFKREFGIQSIIHGMLMPWSDVELKWGFWLRLIANYYLNYQSTQVMQDLKSLIGNKDYFIVTSNGECHFELAGFSAEKIFEVEGNWINLQCSKACHDTLYEGRVIFKKLCYYQDQIRVPVSKIPRCPKCGDFMVMQMGAGQNQILDIKARARLQTFLERYHGKKLVVLELGIGWRNQLIKAPLMYLVNQEPLATYITLNKGEIYIEKFIKDKAYGLDGDLRDTLAQIREMLEHGNIRA